MSQPLCTISRFQTSDFEELLFFLPWRTRKFPRPDGLVGAPDPHGYGALSLQYVVSVIRDKKRDLHNCVTFNLVHVKKLYTMEFYEINFYWFQKSKTGSSNILNTKSHQHTETILAADHTTVTSMLSLAVSMTSCRGEFCVTWEDRSEARYCTQTHCLVRKVCHSNCIIFINIHYNYTPIGTANQQIYVNLQATTYAVDLN